MQPVYNFSAGPAVLPREALEEAQADLLNYKNSGMSILESSHRGKEYSAVHEEACANIRELLDIPDDYAVIFLQGGASMQFAMVPMNLLEPGKTADYANSGAWAEKAIEEAQLLGKVNIAADCAKETPARVPFPSELKLTPGAAYLHITSNETISGAQWKEFPVVKSPLVADMSSDILSRPIDVSRFGLIYAGAQKNLGPAGVALVIIRKDLAERARENVPTMLRYKTHIENNSLFNTPPCFAIYMIMLVTRWTKRIGLNALHGLNVEKAAKIYETIDKSSFFRGVAALRCRSDMNVTFRLPTEKLEKMFAEEAEKRGLNGLKGHRSVGGLRASIYNAFPMRGVDALVAFMREFEQRHG